MGETDLCGRLENNNIVIGGETETIATELRDSA